MIIKLIGCALIAAAGFAAGCFKTQKLAARRDFYEKLSVFVSLLETQIRFNGGDIFTLVDRCLLSAGLESGVENLDGDRSFGEVWEKLIGNTARKYRLNNSDNELLSDFGSALGTTDIEGQLKHIGLYKGLFKNAFDDCRKTVTEKSRIYRSLGLFAGISAALIIL